MALIAQFERDIIKERQREGIAIAKKEGKFKKPKIPKPDNWNELREKYLTRQITATELAKRCKVSRALIYKWLKAE